MDRPEIKSFAFELKDDVSESGQFEGYAAIIGNLDRNGDVIFPGAFKKTLTENSEVPILWQHNPLEPIGVGQAVEDTKGLRVSGTLNMDVQRAREARSLMKQRALKGLSIGYRAIGPTFGPGPDGEKRVRQLKEIKLYEFSPVTFPANPLATFDADSIKSALVDVEEFLALVRAVELDDEDEKAGRVLSGANTDRIRAAITVLQALLNDAATSGVGKGAADLLNEPDSSTRGVLDAVNEAKVLAAIRGAQAGLRH